MPDIQKLHEKYRGDPQVAILTIDTGDDPAKVGEWMKQRGFDFPVLLDDGYVAKMGIQGFRPPGSWMPKDERRSSWWIGASGWWRKTAGESRRSRTREAEDGVALRKLRRSRPTPGCRTSGWD
jgi:hypothetical protein